MSEMTIDKDAPKRIVVVFREIFRQMATLLRVFFAVVVNRVT